MKQIINGKTYDTATSEGLAEASSDCGHGDFRYWEESLYRTPKGRYFVAGEGGPMSSWAKSCGQNSYSGGSGIRVLTEDEARTWVEQWCNSEYEDIFGEAESA